MSIPERLADAELLLRHGRNDGALLSVLVAIGATSRKRYPNDTKSDREAFCTFLEAELKRHRFMHVAFLMGQPASPTPPPAHPAFEEWHKQNLMPLAHVFYKLCRNGLCHQAELDPRVHFIDGPVVTHAPGKIPIQLGLPIRYITALGFVVTEAEENAGLFTEEEKAAWPAGELGPLRTNFDHLKAFLESNKRT